MKKYILLLIILFLLGCSSNLGTLSLVSTLKDEINEEYESIGLISGRDTQYIIFGIPTGFPRIDNAVNDALIKNNAVYLTNTKVTYDRVFFFIYFGFMEYKVTGEGWVEVGQVLHKKQDKSVINKSPQKTKYDPKTGLPIKPTKYDPQTGEPIYE